MALRLRQAEANSDPGFGVYIHWPFCAQKCPYCDFNSHVRFGGWDEARFLAAYLRELDTVAGLIANSPSPRRPLLANGERGMPEACLQHDVRGRKEFEQAAAPHPSPLPTPKAVAWGEGTGRTVSSIFFGGGTPSLMKPETVGAILDHIAKLWPVDPNAEITLEANPGSVEAERFKGYRDAGVNRVSMGLQSLRDEDLKKLGRIHTVAESKAALKIAQRSFERLSFDLIYARPNQAPGAWREELTEALDLAGDHISLYQLTIEPDTPYAALHAAGKLIVPDPDAALALYEITQELTEAKGLAAYEISNHARLGQESQHNLLYWRYGEYAGVGPGAHGRLLIPSPRTTQGEGAAVRTATVTEKNPEAWVAAVEAAGAGFTEQTSLSRAEQADEMLLMGLRLREGVSLDRLASLGGVKPSAEMISDLTGLGLLEVIGQAGTPPSGNWRADEWEPIAMCVNPGLNPAAQPSGQGLRIRATPQGRFVLNAVVAKLSGSFETAAALSAMDNTAAPL